MYGLSVGLESRICLFRCCLEELTGRGGYRIVECVLPLYRFEVCAVIKTCSG